MMTRSPQMLGASRETILTSCPSPASAARIASLSDCVSKTMISTARDPLASGWPRRGRAAVEHCALSPRHREVTNRVLLLVHAALKGAVGADLIAPPP